MYRQANLAKSAEDLSFKILSSIPLSTRFASMLREAMNDQWKGFNAVVHAGMILKGVKDMPPIELRREYPNNQAGFNRLVGDLYSKNYGAKAGQKAWNVTVAKLGGRGDLAEELLQDYAANFWSKYYPKLDGDKNYKSVWSWVLWLIGKRATDVLREQQKIRKRDIPTYMGEDEDPLPELKSVAGDELLDAFRERLQKEDLEDQILGIIQKARPKLEAVHEHAASFVMFRLGLGPHKNLKNTKKWLAEVQPVNNAGRVMWGETKLEQQAGASGWAHFKKKIDKVLLSEVRRHLH